jgi:hypothetical protein
MSMIQSDIREDAEPQSTSEMQNLLADLAQAERKLRSAGAGRPDVVAHANDLAGLVRIVSAPPRVVLLGEVNSGKTSLANRLLDEPVLPVGVLANTRRPQIIYYSERTTITGLTPDGRIDLLADHKADADAAVEHIEIGIPSRRLQNFHLLDTPGVTPMSQFDPTALPTCDLFVWCTLATQAWRESERSYWMSLPPRYQRNAILVATHRDCLRHEGEANQVRARLTVETSSVFRSIVMVGKRSAADAEMPDDGNLAELDKRINEGLADISKRRIAATYRIAGHIVRRGLTLMGREPRPASPELRLVASPGA